MAEAGGPEELAALLPALDIDQVHVAILDLRLPPTWSDEGIHLARDLRAQFRGIGVLILSGYEADVQLHYATQALSNLDGTGGMGYLFKDRTNREILQEAVSRIANGRVVVDPIFSQQAAAEYRERQQSTSNFTPREVDVLDLLVQGLTNREIAEKLFISVPVVERHLTRIFKQVLAESSSREVEGDTRRENRRVLTVLDWLRRTGRLE